MKSSNSSVVTLFVPTLAGGGAERVMILIANELAASGEEVDLVTGNSSGPYIDLISQEVRLVDLKSSRLLFAIPQLAKYFFRTKPKTVLSALNHANTVVVALNSMLSRGTRVVISIHNSLEATGSSKGLNLSSKVVKLARRVTFLKADHVVTVSNGIRDQILETYHLNPERVTSIYNPLDYENISELAVEPVVNNWINQDSTPVVLGIGSLTEQKNFDLLIRSFKIARSSVPCRLVILGEGKLRPKLLALVNELGLEDDVLMPGFVSNPFSWLNKSKVFVLSSDWEGLPGVLLEALACGTQIVATDCKTGPNEILENGKWGSLVEVGNQDQLADAIVSAIREKSTIDTMVRARDFSIEKAVSSYRSVLFEGLLDD